MLDLDFHAALPYGALYRESRIHPGIWTWTPKYCLLTYPDNLEYISQLTGAGWLPIGTLDETLESMGVLVSQLGQMRILGSNIWIPRADYDHPIPVLLAFTSAPAQAESSQTLPPSNLGEIGIILGIQSDKRGLIRCPISKLPKESQQLQHRMGAALSALASAHLERAAWLERWKELQAMARKLAADYWRAYVDAQKEPPYVPDVFTGGMAWTALNMGLRGLQASINHKNDWKQEPGVLPYHDSQYENSQVRVWLQDPAQTSIDYGMASEELLKRLASLDDLTADVVRIQIAQAFAAANSGLGDAILTPEAILEYRGRKPIAHKEGGVTRYSGQRTEDREDVVKAFDNTAWLRLKISQRVPHKSKPIVGESAYVLIKEWWYQPTLDDSPGRLIYWQYQMGTWLAPFLDETEAGRYFGVLMKRTLEYNLKDELVEKRLSSIFAIQLLIAAKSGGAASCKFYVGRLIDECAMPIDRRNPQRTKDRFEKALRQLVTDGIIGDWDYTNDSPLPARQWLEEWRGRSIVVTLGPQALQAYDSMLKKAQARRALAAPQQSKKQGKRKHA
jgi:hypothetical protein